jgi:hypothetical protein
VEAALFRFAQENDRRYFKAVSFNNTGDKFATISCRHANMDLMQIWSVESGACERTLDVSRVDGPLFLSSDDEIVFMTYGVHGWQGQLVAAEFCRFNNGVQYRTVITNDRKPFTTA